MKYSKLINLCFSQPCLLLALCFTSLFLVGEVKANNKPIKAMPAIIYLLLGDDPCVNDIVSLQQYGCAEIQQPINLQGGTVNLPAGVSVRYDGGSIGNGTLNFNGGTIDGGLLNTNLNITGNVQLSSTTFNFVAQRWNIVEGNLGNNNAALYRAALNTEEMNNVIGLVHSMGASTFNVGSLDAYFYGLGNYGTNGTDGDYIYYDIEGSLENAILIPSNFHFKMSANTILRVQPSNNPADRLLAVINESNVTISGGTLIGDRPDHDYACAEDEEGLRRTTHEYGVLINLQGAHSTVIDKVIMEDSTGDGIGAFGTALRNPDGTLRPGQRENFDITIKDVKIYRSRRNNISLTDGREIEIIRTLFKDAGHGDQIPEQQYVRALAPGEAPSENPKVAALGGKGCAFKLDGNGNKIPVYIDANNNFTTTVTVEPYTFPIPNTSGTLPRAGIDLESFRSRDSDNGNVLQQWERISHVDLIDNDFVGNTLDVILYSTDNALIEGNTFGDGIHATSAAHEIEIKNNTFEKGDVSINPYSLVDRAIFIQSVIKNVNGVPTTLMHDFDITGNVISGYSTGIVISGNDINVSGNTINESGNGVTLRQKGNNIQFNNNTITSSVSQSRGYSAQITEMINVEINGGDINVVYRPLSLDRFNANNSNTHLTIDDVNLTASGSNGELWISNSQGVVIKNSTGSGIVTNFTNGAQVNLQNNTGF